MSSPIPNPPTSPTASKAPPANPSVATDSIPISPSRTGQRRTIPPATIQAMSYDELFECLVYDDVDISTIRACLQDPRTNPDFSAPPLPGLNRVQLDELCNAVRTRARTNDFDIVQTILQKIPNPKLEFAAVSAAIEYGTPHQVKSLIPPNRVNLSDSMRGSYLHFAARLGKLTIVELLVAMGAKSQLRDMLWGGTTMIIISPAQCAALFSHKETLEYMLKHFPMDSPEDWQQLVFAGISGVTGVSRIKGNIISMLHEKRLLDVNLATQNASTLLHLAAEAKHLPETMVLLDCGANPLARDGTGKTPWDIWQELKWPPLNDSMMKFINLVATRKTIGVNLSYAKNHRFDVGQISFEEAVRRIKDRPSRNGHRPLWVSLDSNNDAIFTTLVCMLGVAMEYDDTYTAEALRFLSRTFTQLDTFGGLLKFRESSYNTIQLKGNAQGQQEEKIISLVVSRPIYLGLGLGLNNSKLPCFDSDFKETVRGRRVELAGPDPDAELRSERAMNTHEPLTLDESYYLGLNREQLANRNSDQVVSRVETVEGRQRVLMVTRLWMWKMNNAVVSANPSGPSENRLREEFGNCNLTSLQLAAWLFSEHVNFLDRPTCAGLKEPVFYSFEKEIATIYDEVQGYVKAPGMEKIKIEKEKTYLYRINDIKDELAMIRNVLAEQEEVWELFHNDISNEIKSWNTNLARHATRPKEQIPKFQRRVQKITEDAGRVEEWIKGQLELKKTFASLEESHNSTLLSTAVIGFTVVTIIFTPLSFMASLLAIPDGKFGWNASGKTYMTVAEIATLAGTILLVFFSLWWLKRRDQRMGGEEESEAKDGKGSIEWKASTRGKESEPGTAGKARAWLTRPSKWRVEGTADLELV